MHAPADSLKSQDTYSDKAHVRDVIENYFHGLDTRDQDRLAACFTEDAVATHHHGSESEFTLSGGAEIARYFCAFMRKFTATSHARSNSVVEITGDEAAAMTLSTVHVISNDQVRIRGIKYVDELVRVNGRWRIARRKHIQLWQYEAVAVKPNLPR